MRLVTFCAAAWLAASLPVQGQSTPLTPLSWPAADAGEPAIAMHCAAVMTALGRAYAFAAELADRTAGSVGALPDILVERAGGPSRLPEIEARADAWRDHSESMGATNFYPRLAGNGTPYLADDGWELMLAVRHCAERFAL